MQRHFTLEYWMDDGWYVGRLREIPGVFSQGETFEELKKNIMDAYHMMIKEEHLPSPAKTRTKEVLIKV